MGTLDEKVRDFLAQPRIAVAGVSCVSIRQPEYDGSGCINP
ncbi:MAG: hypothetical protein QN178_04625 [Armatimonadota bacterium]|nr:hypothetical protein [Armatimonadota bacterium]